MVVWCLSFCFIGFFVWFLWWGWALVGAIRGEHLTSRDSFDTLSCPVAMPAYTKHNAPQHRHIGSILEIAALCEETHLPYT